MAKVNKNANIARFSAMIRSENPGYTPVDAKGLLKDIRKGNFSVLSDDLHTLGVRAAMWDTSVPVISYYLGKPAEDVEAIVDLDLCRVYGIKDTSKANKSKLFVPTSAGSSAAKTGGKKSTKSKKDEDDDAEDLLKQMFGKKTAKALSGLAALLGGDAEDDEPKKGKRSKKERKNMKLELIKMINSCNDTDKVRSIRDVKLPHRPFAGGELWRVRKDLATDSLICVCADKDKNLEIEVNLADIMFQ